MTANVDPGSENCAWQQVAGEILRLSSTFTTSTQACSRGVLVSAPCPAGDTCQFCPGLRQLQQRNARPVREEPL